MRISILGPMEVEGDGGPIALGGLRLRALLALLALEAGHTVTSARLIDALWPDEPPANAPNALQTLVRRLRAALRPYDVVESRPGGYALAVAADDVDALRFRRLGADGLDLWRGAALTDLTAVPVLANVAAALEEQRLAAVEARAEERLEAGLPVDLTAEAAAHPLRERLRALAMRALAASGRQAEALELYERTRRTLAEELGVDPGPELRAAHLAVLSGDSPPRPPAPPKRPGIRAPRTSFVGRENELDRLVTLLGEAALVTLVGPGGAGKTRLATELALRLGDDRLWMVELASLSDPGDVEGVLLDALGLRDDRLGGHTAPTSGDPLAQVAAALAGRHALLVLDNCEHLVEAVAVVVERLLTACPDLRVLATGREPLNVSGEHLVPVPPLPQPPAGAGPEQARTYPSVRLLLDRATAARPAFTLDDANTAAVVELCRRLDGMPLAIELAAARLRTMTPRQLADRIGDRFTLLTGGSRTALPRQQTLRAVVEWSWDLLAPEERVLARRLGVFAGGATLETVEQVCGGAADVLGALVDKSLVQVSPDGRYRMLETIRAYALERLEEAGEAAAYRRRHAAQLLALAERAVPELRTAAQIGWIERLAAERDDFAAALRWALDERDTETALRLCAALNWYWWMCGYRQESAVWAGQVLDLAGDEPPPGLAGAYAACVFARGVDAFLELSHDRSALLALARRMDDLVELAEREGPVHPMLRLSGIVMTAVAGQDERAAELRDAYAAADDLWLASSALLIGPGRTEEGLERAVAGFRKLGDRWGLSEALLGLATLRAARGAPTAHLIAETWSLTSTWVSSDEAIGTLVRLAYLRATAGDLDGAKEDLAKARAHVDAGTSVPSRLFLGQAEAAHACRRGDLDRGVAIFRELFALLDDLPPIAQYEVSLRSAYGRALAQTGDLDAALDQHHRALDALGGDDPDRPLLSVVLAGYALLAQAGGDQERAAALFGAAAAVEPHDTSPETVAGEQAARSALGDDRFTACFTRGATMPAAQARALAREPGVGPGAGPGPHRTRLA
ncbi:Predicted ATPase [Nonomuraea maritima]|uniref:Predicted ATPase n=1 Tax=Nonomuraea maritima TaxID=683260 RepID=A0A1G9LST2_9ACTN|nr:BTAD domain-containing putative transcriptional regulator [Nonomuraea maritima]SDL65132.1 Predicted ATPase [Nonomuraea maritima]